MFEYTKNLMSMPRMIAFYLPQYHPIKENDEWWGNGFTEWTNTAKAKPLFPGHYQPNVPADLGFYDLRLPESRAAQAALAKKYGIEAFCYYHYWFAGKEILETPLREVINRGEPDLGFCTCWANQTWSGIWHGNPNKILIEQTYPGDEDHQKHFESLLPVFLDQRHILVDGKPVFVIYRPMELPNVRRTVDFWQKMARSAGLNGLHFVGVHESPDWIPEDHGFDAVITAKMPSRRGWISRRHPWKWLRQKYEIYRGHPTIHQYKDVANSIVVTDGKPSRYPCVVPNWDNTPRSMRSGMVLQDSTPELFRVQLRVALDGTQNIPVEKRLIFLKSWNEWAEGNYVEPDLRFGHAYLQVIQEELMRSAQ
jgi:lipopolysaccharide biosynthesis protein